MSAAAPRGEGAVARGASDAAGWSGLLRVDKPAGVTSHDVVAAARRGLGVDQAGHLGTLDPGASGLLLLALGAATRCATVWQGGEKTYEAVVRFGVVTSTQDLDGEVLETRPAAHLDEATVRAAARALEGGILQVPPMVSALRRRGQRLYRLARRGETVERAPRPVRVCSWEWLWFALPEAAFRVRCSSGTYVRTLGHDLGVALGTGGAIRALRRLRSEPFGLEDALTLPEIENGPPARVFARGIALDEALATLPALTLDATGAEQVGRGGRPAVRLEGPAATPPLGAGSRSVVLRDAAGRALALGELTPDPARPGWALASPHLVFPWAARGKRA